MRWWKISPKKFATLKLLLGQDVKQLPKYENKKPFTNDFNDLYLKWKLIIASISTAIAPEILKAQVNSMSSFAELLISQFKLLILAWSKFDFAASIDEAWDMHLRFEENILNSVLPLRIKIFTKHQWPFFYNKLLSLKRKKRKAERKYRKSKSALEYTLSVDYTLRMHWWKISRKEFATLKLLVGQDIKRLPKYGNKK